MGEANATPHGDMRVLIVEDSALVAMDLEATLELAGYQILGPVYDLAGGFEMIEREQFDLALLDIDLNGVKSFPLASELLARGIQVAFLTGYTSEQVRPPEFSHCPYLEKPVDERDLLNVVDHVHHRRDLVSA